MERNIKSSKQLKWISGLKAAFSSLGAKQRDQYSWLAKGDGFYVFTAEIDHIHKEGNKYNHTEGLFEKYVPPLTKETGHASLSISHSQELFDAVKESYETKVTSRLLLVKGTKFGTTKGNIRAAADPDSWKVALFHGSVSEGYNFTLKRVD